MVTTRHLQLPLQLCDLTPARLLAYFREGWSLCEELFGSIDPVAMHMQPGPSHHPFVVYYGHSAAFFINKLCLAGLRRCGVDTHLDGLLARRFHPAAAYDQPSVNWPTSAVVRTYREHVYTIVEAVIGGIEDSRFHVGPLDPLWALVMGLEHQRLHFEAISVLIRQLPVELVKRPAGWHYAAIEGIRETPSQWCTIPGQRVTLGKPSNVQQYHWDTEVGALEVDVPAFQTHSHLVTNRDFLDFWRGGGYTNPRLWTDAGWAWREANGVLHPRFWVDCDAKIPRYRAVFDNLALPGEWPVEVNAHEALAYCRYMGPGMRLMTEPEYAAMTQDAPLAKDDACGVCAYNLNLRQASPQAVGSDVHAMTPTGVSDPFGNVWQWLADDFAPLPGFAPHPYCPDFSAPYFDGQHAMLKGGSWASTGTAASRWYRLGLRPHSYRHAGFRLTRDAT